VPKLDVYQSLWAMDPGRGSHDGGSTEEYFALIKNAGFAGAAIDLAASDRETAYKTMPLFRQYELGCVINAFPASMDDVLPVLEMAREFNAVVVNIIAQVIPSGVEEASLMVQDWMEEAEKENINIEFETHRNSVTNDLGYTVRLLESVPHMKLGVDLSHYVVDREFELPLKEEEAQLIDKILRRADAFEASDKLIFQTELAPPEYAMTGPDGMEMSNRWEESLIMKGWVEDLWKRLDKEEIDAAVSSDKEHT